MNTDARILFLSSGPPVDTGGGSRRTSQLLDELHSRFGGKAVAFVTRAEILSNLNPIKRKALRVLDRMFDGLDNPFQFFSPGYGTCGHTMRYEAIYRRLLTHLPNIRVCIIEHLEFSAFSRVNRALGIRTILAPWAFGSLTLQLPHFVPALRRAQKSGMKLSDRLQVRTAFVHFANELTLSASADRAWMLSKLEVGFLEGVGQRAGYFPYYPSAQVIQELRALRGRRTRETVDDNLFVITSSSIDQNMIALQDFLKSADFSSFPRGSRIEIVGVECASEHEAARDNNDVKILYRGRLPQDEFDDLLVRARAILIPQTCGFGVITRIMDMLLAGIPVVADGMVANATGEVPGAVYVSQIPAGWSEAINRVLTQPVIVPSNGIEPWLLELKNMVRSELAIIDEWIG